MWITGWSRTYYSQYAPVSYEAIRDTESTLFYPLLVRQGTCASSFSGLSVTEVPFLRHNTYSCGASVSQYSRGAELTPPQIRKGKEGVLDPT